MRCVVLRFISLAILAAATACATTHLPPADTAAPIDNPPDGVTQSLPDPKIPDLPNPRVAERHARLQCVPYARRETGIDIHGNANLWWQRAAGRFERSHVPARGTVMAFKGSASNPRGHVAVVREIRGPRELTVDHANWLGGGEISVETPVIDVSQNNDWSKVRVYFVPSGQWGARVFPVAGFIYPDRRVASR
jgi:hypothetical protein